MKRGVLALLLALAALAALGLAGAARADFAAGVAAYDEGDYETALAEWRPLAEAGDPAAQRNLGHLYRKGLGTERNLITAADWYRRAAEVGFARAQANLASLFLRGDGVEQDYNEAAKWFDRAARQDHAIAQFNLGLMYERGLGVPRSREKAFGWYYQAARAGHTRAAEKLAGLVSDSLGPGGGTPPLPDPPPIFKTTEPVRSVDTGTKAPAPPAETAPASSPPVQEASPSAAEAASKPAVAAAKPAPAATTTPTTTPATPAVTPAATTPVTPVGMAAEVEIGDEKESSSGSLLQFIFNYNNDILYPDRSPAPTAVQVQEETEEPQEDPAAEKVAPGDGAGPLMPDGDADDQGGTATVEAVEEEPVQAPASEAPDATGAAAESPPPATTEEGVATADTTFSMVEWLRAAGEQKTLKITGGGNAASRAAPPPAPAPTPAPTPAPAPAPTPAPTPAKESKTAPASPAPAGLEVSSRIVVPGPRTRRLDPARLREGQTAFDAGDHERALAAWGALAESEDPEAQFLVGRMYSNGEGTEPDLEQAYAWLSLAANRDHIEAAKALRKLARDMTLDQIAAAEYLVEARHDRR